MATPDYEMAQAFEEHGQDSPYNTHYDRPAVQGLIGAVAGLRVLDAGCGQGLYAELRGGEDSPVRDALVRTVLAAALLTAVSVTCDA